MAIRLPTHFRARTVPNETCVALPAGIIRIRERNTLRLANSPATEDPIGGDSHTPRQSCFNARVGVDEVDGAGASCGEHAKIIALGE